MVTNKFWTAERTARLLTLNKSEPIDRTAEMLGCQVNSAISKLGSLGVRTFAADGMTGRERAEAKRYAAAEAPQWPPGIRFEDTVPSKADGRGRVPQRCEISSGNSSALGW